MCSRKQLSILLLLLILAPLATNDLGTVGLTVLDGTLEGWECRKGHDIIGSPSGAQVDYQMRLVVHYGSGTDYGEDIYCNSLCKGDFGDIRFTDSDGNMMHYWMEEKTDFDKATIWVKVPYIPSYPNRTEIYTQYGNPDASTISNGKATFLIFDDFNDNSFNTSLWEDISAPGGSVSETGGVLQLNSPPGSRTCACVRSKVTYTGECSCSINWR